MKYTKRVTIKSNSPVIVSSTSRLKLFYSGGAINLRGCHYNELFSCSVPKSFAVYHITGVNRGDHVLFKSRKPIIVLQLRESDLNRRQIERIRKK